MPVPTQPALPPPFPRSRCDGRTGRRHARRPCRADGGDGGRPAMRAPCALPVQPCSVAAVPRRSAAARRGPVRPAFDAPTARHAGLRVRAVRNRHPGRRPLRLRAGGPAGARRPWPANRRTGGRIGKMIYPAIVARPVQPRCAADAAGAALTWARFTRQTAVAYWLGSALAFLPRRLGHAKDQAIYGAPPRSLLALVSLAASAASHTRQRRS